MESIIVANVVVLEESPCPRGSPRTNFQVLVLVLGAQVLSLSLLFPVGGGRVTAPIVSRKFKMRRGSVGSRWLVEEEARACVSLSSSSEV